MRGGDEEMMVYFAAMLGVIGGVLWWRFAPALVVRRRARMVSQIIERSHIRAGLELEVEIEELVVLALVVIRFAFRVTPDLLDEHYEELESVQANNKRTGKIFKRRHKK